MICIECDCLVCIYFQKQNELSDVLKVSLLDTVNTLI